MVEPFRIFDVRVRRLERLSPHFLRVTFTGDRLHLFADNGFDQRIKVIFPLPGIGVATFPRGADWFSVWRSTPSGERHEMRTYTVRAVRPEAGEVDVDFVMHGDEGPAARWINRAEPGVEAALFGPQAGYDERHGGLEFRPPADCGTVLLAGDETATPAILTILEGLPAGFTGEALLEVPGPEDFLEVRGSSDVKVTWLARGDGAWGSKLQPAVELAAGRLLVRGDGAESFVDVDVDAEELWEVPEETLPSGSVYAWLAGEAAMIRGLRRHLVAERGMDRRAVAFMGYWRMGRAEVTE
ncbi:siderophore-interacting protein [Nonomuraea soli]|uniref:NADPH-dependent ferric siderophore reductase n=1 Tax=Nonomuraea soli TaxID=1032476 RepID=A0A7W0CEX2_9ACTN|nr:siderophore-interacting protein [Nonomuraea soli]MBA2889918.1 NADPH-dependent ferric siderophore reductase [Nonomuraea soli]